MASVFSFAHNLDPNNVRWHVLPAEPSSEQPVGPDRALLHDPPLQRLLSSLVVPALCRVPHPRPLATAQELAIPRPLAKELQRL